MANPQAENGHIDIANEIAEQLMKTNFSAYQWRVLWAIWRKTYGWHKKKERISVKELVKMTELKHAHVSRALKELELRKVIIRTPLGTKRGATIGFQKDFEQWKFVPHGVYRKRFVPNGVHVRTQRGTEFVPNGVQINPANLHENRGLPPPKEKKETIQKKRSSTYQAIQFSFGDRKFQGITEIDIKQWSEAYPAVDVEIEIKQAAEWLLANPAKRKINYRRFLVNWFKRSQDRGGSQASRRKDRYAIPDDWLTKEKRE